MPKIRLTERRKLIALARERAESAVREAIRPVFHRQFKRLERFLRKSNLRKKLGKIKIDAEMPVEQASLTRVELLFKAPSPPKSDQDEWEKWKEELLIALLLGLFSAVDEFGTPFGDLHSLTERIGLANGSFNLLSGCIPVNATETLHCYTDIDIDLVTPEGEFGCSSLVGLNEYSDENVILAFPNPGAEQFTIQWPNETFHSVLMDQAGREVLRKSNASGAIRFDTSQLAKGAYQVITTNEKGDRSFSRWVKQ